MPVQLLTAATFTRPNDTTTYASGDLVANNTSAASVAAMTFALPTAVQPGRDILIRRAFLRKSASVAANGTFRAHFFSGTVTVTTNGDNALFTPTAMTLYLGYIEVVMSSQLGGWGFAAAPAADVIWTPAASTDVLNALLEARAAYVPAAQEVFTLQPEITYTL